MEYQVPQFIDVEDKIFGPLTLKQFIYLAGGGGLVAICLLVLPLFVGILLALPIAGLALALAFYKLNGKPFIDILEAGVLYVLGGRTYLWKKEKRPLDPAAIEAAAPAPAPVPSAAAGLTRRKLDSLAWSLDVRDTGTQEDA